MPFLIDGHNLIPKLGLRLDSVDDELELIQALQEFGRASRRTMEVYFDGAPAGQAGSHKFGMVTAHFVSQASTADAGIMRRLQQLGGAAKNWTVVTSDREVLRAASTHRARSETSEEFARRLRRRASSAADEDEGRMGGGANLSETELLEWLDLFRKR